MDFARLTHFIEIQDGRLAAKYPGQTGQARLHAATVKIAEEFGELCSAVLADGKLQRDDKLVRHDRENLEEEFADTLITTLLLAHMMGVDIGEALERRMKTIEGRAL